MEYLYFLRAIALIFSTIGLIQLITAIRELENLSFLVIFIGVIGFCGMITGIAFERWITFTHYISLGNKNLTFKEDDSKAVVSIFGSIWLAFQISTSFIVNSSKKQIIIANSIIYWSIQFGNIVSAIVCFCAFCGLCIGLWKIFKEYFLFTV